ncbi:MULTISPECIES: mercury(II) reductase [Acetobacteraceae]|uniref:Mercuric reductase n=2 Tax=Acetobacteraceae TaxID=433 RepID=A0A6S6PPY3_ACEAC|nr:MULTISPECIES: mercury(II) reductase [Acetobacteraceae]BAK85310.1 dihydrolipoamide dehydrogenase [Komagataeibacter medellinensis NBRC 3288]BCI69130.1 mercuric reductase [Acetobacter aceti]
MSDCCTTEGSRKGGYDLAVIGAGSAGFSAAITAADQGANVALIGHGTIGGTCVNVGCVPSKTMIRAAEALHGVRAAQRFPGLVGEASVANWPALVAAKDELVTSLRQKKYIDLLPEYNGVAYLEGAARLNGQGVMVNGAAISAGKIIIATGSSPALPDIPGIEEVPYLTSTTALELGALPRSLLVIGGGYIGCELAQMFARFGVAVTLITRRRLLPEAEPEISEALTGYLRDEGITVRTGLTYRGIARTAAGVELSITTDGAQQVIAAEQVLVATGRAPNTDGLGLVEAGIAQADNGSVVVDDRMRTSRPDVYAAGDVTGRDQFVYMAAYGAKLAAHNALNGDDLVYDNTVMPWVTFTDPQVAGVGLSERAAQAAGFETKTSIVALDQVPRALAARDTRGLIKLVADKTSDRLLGGQIVAPEGADSIQTMVLAIKHGMTTKALGETIFPYLTTVEGLKLAAQGFGKDVAKLSCCAG